MVKPIDALLERVEADGGLIKRLTERAEDDRRCQANNEVVADALSDQMERFEQRIGHNIYAVRMAVDHASSAKRDAQYAADLELVVALLTALSNRGEHHD